MADISGTINPRFAKIQEIFERNFDNGDDLGASVALIVDGEMVIDLDSRDRVTNVNMVGAGRDRFELRWRN